MKTQERLSEIRVHPRLSAANCAFSIFLSLAAICQGQPSRWSEPAANAWYAKQPWLVGSNYIPSNAVNQLEMWQAGTFVPARIDTELGWAEKIGMNTMRVFLHDLLWEQDPGGFRQRIDTFLQIADRHHIKTMFVLFDSCWDPNPKLGPQAAPRAGIHNSGWVQSPGRAALSDPGQYPRLERYVKGVIGAFAKDQRVLAWDLWNEPDNNNTDTYPPPKGFDLSAIVIRLLPRIAGWAREAGPGQPLTCGLRSVNPPGKLSAVEKIEIESSDVISFHVYSHAAVFKQDAFWLRGYNRPILCTEYLARPLNSTFESTLPLAKQLHIGAYSWGLVNGKTQTNLPWDSWETPYRNRAPDLWFQDIFRQDGRPYRASETEFIRNITR
jgi:hypothetical protein